MTNEQRAARFVRGQATAYTIHSLTEGIAYLLDQVERDQREACAKAAEIALYGMKLSGANASTLLNTILNAGVDDDF